MKNLLLRTLLSIVFIICSTLVQANSENKIQLSSPGKLCFPQTMLYAEYNQFNRVMLDHFLIVSEEHHFKDGFVYVGFRLKSEPDELWLFNGLEWTNNSGSDYPVPFIASVRNGFETTELQPVIQTFISNYPVDISTHVDDGELWVGYGLIEEGADRSLSTISPVAFDDMINHQRFNRVLEIGKQDNINGLVVDQINICLTVTELERTRRFAVSTANEANLNP
ncbi:MAG: hypothetical protein RI993_813 [Pseudomonadota bacterium]|jgi:hypothetical protein